MMDLIEIHFAFAEIVVLVKRRKVVSDGRDQIVIDRRRNIVGIQGLAKSAVVSACSGVVDVFLDRARKRCGQSVFRERRNCS